MDNDRLISVLEDRIIWHAVKLTVVNRSQRRRDWIERGKEQDIMTGLGRVKEGGYVNFSSAAASPIYAHMSEALLLSNILYSFQVLTSIWPKVCIMPRLWRVQSKV